MGFFKGKGKELSQRDNILTVFKCEQQFIVLRLDLPGLQFSKHTLIFFIVLGRVAFESGLPVLIRGWSQDEFMLLMILASVAQFTDLHMLKMMIMKVSLLHTSHTST